MKNIKHFNLLFFIIFAVFTFMLILHPSTNQTILIYSNPRFFVVILMGLITVYLGISLFYEELLRINIYLSFGAILSILIIECIFFAFPILFPVNFIAGIAVSDHIRQKIANVHGFRTADEMMVEDGLIYHFKPNIKVKESSILYNLSGEAQIDELGYRNTIKDQKSVEIVLLGDSMIFGDKSPIDIGDLLRKNGHKTLNLSMPGYGPQHYLYSFIKYGLKEKPRYVFVFLFEGNDFLNALAFNKANGSYQKYFSISNNDFSTNTFQTKTILDPIIRRSYFIAFIEGALFHYSTSSKKMYGLAKPPDYERIIKDGSFNSAINSLIKLNDVCNKISAKMILIYLPSDASVYANYYGSNKYYIVNNKEIVHNIERICKNNICFIDLTKTFRQQIKNKEIYLRDDGHLHPEGIGLVSDVILRTLHNRRE